MIIVYGRVVSFERELSEAIHFQVSVDVVVIRHNSTVEQEQISTDN